MLSEDSEDDLHQCGRCMQIFHSISEYFDHKKKKSCSRTKSGVATKELTLKPVHCKEKTDDKTPEAAINVPKTVAEVKNCDESGKNEKNYHHYCFLAEENNNNDNVCTGEGTATDNISASGCAVADFQPSQELQGCFTQNGANPEEQNTVKDSESMAPSFSLSEEDLPHEVAYQKSSATLKLIGSTDKTEEPPSVIFQKWKRGRPPKSITYKIVQLKKPVHWNSKPKLHQCPKCSYVACFKDDYDRHLRKSHNLSAYVCYRCQKAFSDKYKLKRHLQRMCQREPLQAKAPAFTEFSKKINHRPTLNHHSSDENLQVIKAVCYSCHLCDDSFDSYSGIMLHMAKHSNVRPGICKFCGMWFSNRYKLRRHVVSSLHDEVADEQMQAFRKEVEKMKIVCPMGLIKAKVKRQTVSGSKYSQTFLDKATLFHHRDSMHQRNISHKTYLCKVCSDCFESRTKYLLHLKTSHRPSSVQCSSLASRTKQCPVCRRKFQHLSHLTRHRLALHTPHQQIPVSAVSKPLTNVTAAGEEILNDLPSRSAGECLEQNETPAKDFTCFVCHIRFQTADLMKEHVEFHRVWMPHPTDGPIPADLFDPSLTLPPIQALAEPLPNEKEESCINETERNDDSETLSSTSLKSSVVHVSDSLKTVLRYICPYCRKEYDDLQGVYEHKIEEHRLICVFRCIISFCRLVFETADEYVEHSKVHPQIAFICKVCNDHFDDKQASFSHRLSAHRQLLPVAKSLNSINIKKAKLKRKLHKNMSNCTEDRFLDECYESLEKLKPRDKPVSNQKLNDGLCDNQGDSAMNNQNSCCQHGSVNAADRQHVCNICSRAFNKKEHLQRHLISAHTTAKPFVCKEPGCSKAFKRKDKLRDHFKCHSSLKPYSCSVCSRKYRYREGLRYHEKLHEKEQRYKCSECSISFPRPSELRQHLSSAHKVESKKEMYAYQCNICKRAFPRPERLKRHSERDHSIAANWVFRCDLCCKGFAGIKSYETHNARHHSSADDGVQSCSKQNRGRSKDLLGKSSNLQSRTERDRAFLPVLKWPEEQSSSSDNPPGTSTDSLDVTKTCHMSDALVSDAADAYYPSPSTSLGNIFLRPHASQMISTSEVKGEKLYRQSGFMSLASESHDGRFSGYSYVQSSAYNAHYANSSGNECCTITNTEEAQYDSLPEMEVDTSSESNRILRCPSEQFSPGPSVPFTNASTLTYPSYTSRISQASSGLHPSSLGFYHPGTNSYRAGGNGYPFPSEEFPSAPLSFSFARANTFSHANNKMAAKAPELPAGHVPGQFSFTDHTSVPFRPVAMPTQHTRPPTANPYSNETSRFGRWFSNVPLLTNSYDAKQTMLDAVRFSRLPATDRTAATTHPFPMPCHDPYMTSRYPTERQGIPRETSGNMDQRSVFVEYNLMSDDHTAMRREEHFSHSGTSALHPVSSHVHGNMPAMHVSLSLLSQQQQQFPVNDYQWPTMPMYNWL